MSWTLLMLGSTGTNLLRAQQLPVQADAVVRHTAARPCPRSHLAAANSSIGSRNCDSGLWSQNSHSRGQESRCIHGVCILSRQSADSDPSHKVRPVTHFPNIRVCTTKEELAGATRLASPSTFLPRSIPPTCPL